MPGWIWLFLLCLLACAYPTAALVIACAIACFIWPEFRIIAVIAVAVAAVECWRERKRLKKTEPPEPRS